MDNVEAARVLKQQLTKYRPLPYADSVAKIHTVETLEIPKQPGDPWQLEFLFYWDGEPNGDVRVIGSTDDGGVEAYSPLSDSFIKSASGEFVGE